MLVDEAESNYAKYRGKCKGASESAVKEAPSLTLVRGHYICPFWGSQPHWWTVRPDGSVYDPTALQFPSAGTGEYIPFDGIVTCSECSKRLPEEEATIQGNYCFCSGTCYGKFVGVL
jgi:hypothetical protein